MKKLPAPRLQLRWAQENGWICHYELVIPLSEHDIRRDVIGKRGRVISSKKNEQVISMGEPTRRSGNNEPCKFNGERFIDMPYRDGRHAEWDSKALGGIPVYLIAPDGMVFEIEVKEV